jgi:hypothetical protein
MIVSNETIKKISKIKHDGRRDLLNDVVKNCEMYAVLPDGSKFYLKDKTLVAEWNEESWHTYDSNIDDPFEYWNTYKYQNPKEAFNNLVSNCGGN